MLKKSFIGLAKPWIRYEVLGKKPQEPIKVSYPKTAIFYIEGSFQSLKEIILKKGRKVVTGQKLCLKQGDQTSVLSTVTGKIKSITQVKGDFDKSYVAVFIEVSEKQEIDPLFKTNIEDLTLQKATSFLQGIPGNPPFSILTDSGKPIKTIIITGIDSDLLVKTNQYVVLSCLDKIVRGINVLKEITGIEDIILAVSKEFIQGYGHIGAKVKFVDTVYPSGLPVLMAKEILGKVVPAGMTCQDIGICFIGAEAVASLGQVHGGDSIPVDKILTVVDKKGVGTLVSARIGTPVRMILESLNISLEEGDRLIAGGPMTGSAVYTDDYPVQSGTDAILVQDGKAIPGYSDNACINCGECIRVCPVDVPVNMLIRFLEAGQYQQAADSYDLMSCIDCGLCTYVCVSRIPIFQYIKLAKHELALGQTAEAENG